MPYTLKQAAEATGKSKPTILRAIQTGKITAEKDAHGEWQIEPAELHRVYEPVPVRNAPETAPSNDTHHSAFPYETGKLQGELDALRERLAALDQDRERERREAAEQIADLRRRLDQADEERRDKDRKLTALLTHDAPKDQAPALAPSTEATAGDRGFWSWFRRGRATGG